MTALGGLLFALGFVLVVVAWYGRITVPAKFATVALGAPLALIGAALLGR